ncbi:AAA family ATPase [Paenochrobactrum pullorum]|uniref:AAA family ATPase n=1 Tax=Paenochrobactrum pullorum TaxID=1324351 RepID=UPI0035BC8189
MKNRLNESLKHDKNERECSNEQRTKGAIIVPKIETIGEYLVWKTFELAAQKELPNALKSGVPCTAIIVAGKDSTFVSLILQKFLDSDFDADLISGFSESTSVFRYDHPEPLSLKNLLFKYSENNRNFIIAERFQDIPEEIRIVSDEVLYLDDFLDEILIAEAIVRYIDKDAEVSLADTIIARDAGFEIIELAFKKYRSLSNSFDLCASLLRSSRNKGNKPDTNKIEEIASKHRLLMPPKGPKLSELHGFGAAKTWGEDLAEDIADWKLGKIKWSEIDKGMLISGVPGCGKTTFAAALARSCRVNFLPTSLAQWQASGTGHLGDMLKAMRQDFQKAKLNAPCIIFIDEFDSAGDRSKFEGQNAQYLTEVVNALLECIDGSLGIEGVVVLGATNFPDKIDAALRRAGRLDQHIEIPLPDEPAREGILRFHLEDKLKDQNLSEIVEISDGFSGADIEQIVRQAKRFARRQKRELQTSDLLAALPPKRKLSQQIIERMAIHEAGHAVVAHEFGYPIIEAKIITEISIENTDYFAGGSVKYGHHQSEFFITNSDISKYIQRIFGGMAAEKVFYGDHSTGCAADLQHATYYAAHMILAAGMGDDIVCTAEMTRESVFSALRMRRDLQDKLSNMLNDCMHYAEHVIKTRKKHVENLAAALISKGKLSGAEIEEIFSKTDRIDQPILLAMNEMLHTQNIH